MRKLLRPAGPLELELALAGVVIALWQMIRVPLEGSASLSLAHAREWLALEGALRLDFEGSLIRFVTGSPAEGLLRAFYETAHLPALFAFLAVARLAAPTRYPLVRATFVLSFLPAAAIVGLYPLAPPDWLHQLGFGPAPADWELTAGSALLTNATAAAASQHFGYAALIAVATVALAPRSRLAWVTVAYPGLVFVTVIGLGEHYVLDCLAGAMTFALGGLVALASARGIDVSPRQALVPRPQIALAAVGAAIAAWAGTKLAYEAGEGALLPALAFVLAVWAVVVASREPTATVLAPAKAPES